MKKLIYAVLFVSILLNSCKKDEVCTFGSAYLNGKTFTPTKVVQVSDGADVTSLALDLDKCNRNSLAFSSTSIANINAAGCTATNSPVNYVATSSNGTKAFVVSGTSTTVTNFNCSSFEILTTTNLVVGGSEVPVKITYTKN